MVQRQSYGASNQFVPSLVFRLVTCIDEASMRAWVFGGGGLETMERWRVVNLQRATGNFAAWWFPLLVQRAC